VVFAFVEEVSVSMGAGRISFPAYPGFVGIFGRLLPVSLFLSTVGFF
jgi:hypothetical protein